MKEHTFLADYIKIADIHASRLSGALQHAEQWIPFTAESLSKSSLDQTAFLDMMATRFGRLQDIIGAKIFSLILDLMGEDASTLIDKLNKLEKLNYLHDVNWWMNLREIHNQVMHDYPDDYEAISINLALLITKANELLAYWQELKIKIAAL